MSFRYREFKFFCGLFATVGMAHAQSANDYFHSAAQFFIHQKDNECRAAVTEGLSKFPGDPKLAALLGKLKDPENQNQNKQNQNDQDKNKKDKDKKDQDKNDQDKKDQDKKDEDKQNQNPKDDQKRQDQQKPEPTPAQKKQEDMKKDDAKKILEIYADDEQDLKKKPEKKGIGAEKRGEKDW